MSNPLSLPESERHERAPRSREDRRHSATLDVVPRAEFVRQFGDEYDPGQHVTMLGPTQRGKTTLCFQLLDEVITPEHRALLLASKPPGRDKKMEKAHKELRLRRIHEYPPMWSPLDRNKRGYVLAPTQSMTDFKADNEHVRNEFRKGIIANYSSKKPVITVADEGYHLQNKYRLKEEIEQPLISGAPINACWILLQRGRFSTYLAYDAADHVFIGQDPDASNQKRYGEIGGIDPFTVAMIVSQLKTKREKGGRNISEFLYINRAGPEMCIVSMD